MDVQTLFFVEGSLLVLFAVTMVITSLGQQGQAANYWFAASNLVGAVGLGLHPAFHQGIPLVNLALANFLLFVELSLLNKAIAEFVGHGRQIWLGFMALSVLAGAGTAYFVFWHPDRVATVHFVSLMTISTATCSGVLVVRYTSNETKTAKFMMGALFFIYAAHNVLRVLDVAAHPGFRFYHIWIDRTILAGLAFGYLQMSSARLRGQLERQANTDHLTGALNRRAVEQAAASLWPRRRTRPECVSVLMLDMDYFKEINDTHGHDAGDLALKALADTLRQTMRGGDLIARMGGDEFMVVMAGTSATEAEAAVQRLQTELGKVRLQALGGEFGVRASVGMATMDNRDFRLEDLIRMGDRALYLAKAARKRAAVKSERAMHSEMVLAVAGLS